MLCYFFPLIFTNLFQNAFSERLFEHGFNFFGMFVPDFLHEFELGVWKAVFTHLIRILHAFGHDTIQILNERYMWFVYSVECNY
jgi:hypothetical protein